MEQFGSGDYKGVGEEIFTPTSQEKLDNRWWNMRILARNVKRLRLERGWSQSDLADMADIQPYQVCYVEGNRYYSVTLKTLGWIARAFGVTVSVLLDPR